MTDKKAILLSVRVNELMRNKIKEITDKEGRTMTGYIRYLISEDFKKRKDLNK